MRAFQIYQACNSVESLEMCDRAVTTGVFTVRIGGLHRTKTRWDLFGRILEETVGHTVTQGRNASS